FPVPRREIRLRFDKLDDFPEYSFFLTARSGSQRAVVALQSGEAPPLPMDRWERQWDTTSPSEVLVVELYLVALPAGTAPPIQRDRPWDGAAVPGALVARVHNPEPNGDVTVGVLTDALVLHYRVGIQDGKLTADLTDTVRQLNRTRTVLSGVFLSLALVS